MCSWLWVVFIALGQNVKCQDVALPPPAGWQDVTTTRNHPDILLALHGPEQSSFVLTRLEQADLSNRAHVQGLLHDILGNVKKKTGLEFKVKGPIEKVVYKNNLTAYLLRCDFNGRPRLVLGLTRHKGLTMLVTLISSVPELWLPQTLGSIKVQTAFATSLSGRVTSSDGQLALDLPDGFESEELTQKDQAKDMVLAVKGLGSELFFIKILEGISNAEDQTGNVKQTIIAISGVDKTSVSAAHSLKSRAGPSLIYVAASMHESAQAQRLVVGYLPWGYWGYSVFAKGPEGMELLRRCLESLEPGPSAQPGLIAADPSASKPSPSRVFWVLAAALAAIFCALALRGRKK